MDLRDRTDPFVVNGVVTAVAVVAVIAIDPGITLFDVAAVRLGGATLSGFDILDSLF